MVAKSGACARFYAVSIAALFASIAIALVPSVAAAAFSPTFDVTVSTTVAGGHPDLTVMIDNSGGDENLRAMRLSLPDLMMGSLAAVNPRCTLAQAATSTCSEAAKIGTVAITAKVDRSTINLEGSIFMTDGPAGYPAGLSIDVPAVVGGVNLGNVVVPVRLSIRCTAASGDCLDPSAPGSIEGIDAVATDIPKSIISPEGETFFKLEKVALRLNSDTAGPNPPLLFNPTKCPAGSGAFLAAFSSYPGTTATDSVPFQATKCELLPFMPQIGVALSSNVPGTSTTPTVTVDLPRGSAGLRSVVATLPSSLVHSLTGLGASCGPDVAEPPICISPVGTIKVKTPLLPSTSPDGYGLEGEVFLIAPGAGTALARLVARLELPGQGIVVRINARIDIVNGSIQATFDGVPDVPIEAVELALPGDPGYGQLIAVKGASECRPAGEGVFAKFVGQNELAGRHMWGSGWPLTFSGCSLTHQITSGPDLASGVGYTALPQPSFTFNAASGYLTPVTYRCAVDPDPDTVLFSLCDPGSAFASPSPASDGFHTFVAKATSTVSPAQTSITSHGFVVDTVRPDTDIATGPTEGSTRSDATPSFTFTSPENGVTFECSIDSAPFAVCPSSYTTATLADGLHSLEVRAVDRANNADSTPATRTFTVDASDTTPPVITITSGPEGATFERSPQFGFEANEPATFECRIDGAALLPCSSPFAPATPLEPGRHQFTVKGSDGLGNISDPPAVRTFIVETPFLPTADFALSTLDARAHPDLSATILSDATEDLRTVTVNLPDGLMGSLRAAPLCSIADAAAAGCAPSTQIGTAKVEATVDTSIIRLDGKLFLTVPVQAGDPGGLSIVVPARVGAVSLGSVTIPVRIALRGLAQGLDILTGVIPNQIIDSKGSVTSFDLRKVVLDIDGSAGTEFPLLTNRSSCGSSTLKTTFSGYANSTVAQEEPFDISGCENLSFRPGLTVAATNARAGGHPDLTATVSARSDDSGISAAHVVLPPSVDINIAGVSAICSIAAADSGGCPASTQVGDVEVETPLLAEPLAGPVYLVKRSGELLPGLAVMLRGVIALRLNARIVVQDGRVSANFDDVPDVSLSRFVLRINGGPKGVLTLRPTVCRPKQNLLGGEFIGHSGAIKPIVGEMSVGSACSSPTATVKVRHHRGSQLRIAMTVRQNSTLPRMKSIRVVVPQGLKLAPKQVAKFLMIKVGKRYIKGKKRRKGKAPYSLSGGGIKRTLDVNRLPRSGVTSVLVSLPRGASTYGSLSRRLKRGRRVFVTFRFVIRDVRGGSYTLDRRVRL